MAERDVERLDEMSLAQCCANYLAARIDHVGFRSMFGYDKRELCDRVSDAYQALRRELEGDARAATLSEVRQTINAIWDETDDSLVVDVCQHIHAALDEMEG